VALVPTKQPLSKQSASHAIEAKSSSVGEWISVGQVRIGAASTRKAKHQAAKAVKAAAAAEASRGGGSGGSGSAKEPVLTPLMDFSQAVAQLTDLPLDVINFLVLPHLAPANVQTDWA
jgi:hypothetical protein